MFLSIFAAGRPRRKNISLQKVHLMARNGNLQSNCSLRKNPRAHKNKIGTSTPPPFKPPPQRGILWAWGFSSRKSKKCQAPKKFAQPYPAPEHEAFSEFSCTKDAFFGRSSQEVENHEALFVLNDLCRTGNFEPKEAKDSKNIA